MQDQQVIWRCDQGHFFLQQSTKACPRCGGAVVSRHDFRLVDCIACGELCPGNAYCCDEPRPITEADLERARRAAAEK